jgi:hypothetical protein
MHTFPNIDAFDIKMSRKKESDAHLDDVAEAEALELEDVDTSSKPDDDEKDDDDDEDEDEDENEDEDEDEDEAGTFSGPRSSHSQTK